MSDYYDKWGQPIDQKTWAKLMEDMSYRRVAFDELPDGTTISTVWLGIDHGVGGEIRIFETLVSPSQDMDRYKTLEAAKEGHRLYVEKYSDIGGNEI